MKNCLMVMSVMFAIIFTYLIISKKHTGEDSWNVSAQENAISFCIRTKQSEGYTELSHFDNIKDLCQCSLDIAMSRISPSLFKLLVLEEFDRNKSTYSEEDTQMIIVYDSILKNCMELK